MVFNKEKARGLNDWKRPHIIIWSRFQLLNPRAFSLPKTNLRMCFGIIDLLIYSATILERGYSVKITIKKIESPLSFWFMLGPLFLSFILLAVVIRSTPSQWGLPLMAMGGILLCYRWKWRGFLVASGALVALSIYQIALNRPEEWLWNSVLTLALISSFVVTMLLMEESQGILDTLKGQSDNFNGNLLQLEERLSASQKKLEIERQVLMARIEPLKREISEKDEKLQSYDKLVSIVREELASAHLRHEKLLQDLFDAGQHSVLLAQQIEGLKKELVCKTSSAEEFSSLALKETLLMHESEIIELKASLEASLEEERLARGQSESYVLELIHLRELRQAEDNRSLQIQEEQILQKAISEELNDHIETLSREKLLLEATLASLQGELENLFHQDQQKSQIIEKLQTDLQNLKGFADAKVEELKNEKSHCAESLRSHETRERIFSQQVEDLMKKLSNANQQLLEWQRKSLDYSSLNDRFLLLQSQIKDHISEKNQLVQKLELSRQELERVEESRLLSVAKETELHHQLDETKLECAKANEKIAVNEHLESACDSLNIKLTQLQIELEKHIEDKRRAMDQLERLRGEIKEPLQMPDLRRMEGLYQQLRQQFAEKSKILDITRRELFNTQERLASLQKNVEESTVYGNSEMEERLYEILAAATLELKQQEYEHDQETSQLYELVGALIKQKGEI